jgi:heterodisulfide reductase subunit C
LSEENKDSKVDIDEFRFKEGELASEVTELVGDDNLYGCYQCGTCTAGCPYVEEMDLTPDEVIRYIIMDKKDVLDSKTIWLCSSCFTCAERCPRDISITKIMEALRQMILRKKMDKSDLRDISKEEREKIPQIVFVALCRKNIG